VASVQRTAAVRGPLLNFARDALSPVGTRVSPALRRALSARFDDLGSVRAAVSFRNTWVRLRTLLTVEVTGLAVFLIALWSVVAARGSGLLPSGVVVYAAFSLTQQASDFVERLLNLNGVQLLTGRIADLMGDRTLPQRSELRRRYPARIADLMLLRPQEPGHEVPVLEATGLRSDVPSGALAPVDITVSPGTFTVITGPSGVGKSTLLRTLAGVQAPSAGGVTLAGCEPDVLGEHTRAHARYVEADLPLLPVTVAETLAHAPQAVPLLARLTVVSGVTAALDQLIPELSHPQRQLVNLARAFATAPTVVFCDEATSALDTLGERRVLRALRKSAPKTAIIAVLHRPDNLDLAGHRVDVRSPLKART
jgi:ABC-type lipoprotein export system ATPase subunit